MRRHTINHVAFVIYIAVLALASYFVTPWVWLALTLGWTTECGCEECQNIEEDDGGVSE